MLSANGPRYHHRRRAGTRRELRPLTKLRCTACKRTRPADLRRHRCDCWTRGPTAEAPTPSGSMHRDAPAVKARERPRQPFALSFLYMRYWKYAHHMQGRKSGLHFFSNGRTMSCSLPHLSKRFSRRNDSPMRCLDGLSTWRNPRNTPSHHTRTSRPREAPRRPLTFPCRIYVL